MTAPLLLGLLLPLLPVQDRDTRRIMESCRSSVVQLINDESSGSGMLLDEQGLILTNAHVAVSPLPFRVLVDLEGARTVFFNKVTLVSIHPRHDLALVRIDPSEHRAPLKPLRVAPGRALTGDRIFALGHPRGGPKSILPGEVEAVDQTVDMGGYTQISAKVQPGSSGGPIVNLDGQVVGVVTWKVILRKGAAGMAIPMQDLQLGDFVALDRRLPNPSAASESVRRGEQLLKMAVEGNGFASEYALHFFQQAMLEDFNNPDTYYKIGLFHRNAGRYPQAAAYLFRSLRLRPWPDSKAMCYYELAAALAGIRRGKEAAEVLREGLAKYPKEGPVLWDALAILCFEEGAYLEAAVASRCALLCFSTWAERMNQIYRDSRQRMKADELARVLQAEPGLDAELQKMHAEAAKAQKEGRQFMNPEADRIVREFSGVQRVSGLEGAKVEARTPFRPQEKPSAPAGGVEAEDPGDAVFIQSRTRVAAEHYASGRKAQAREILEAVVKAFPEHPEARQARDLLELLRK